MAHSLSSRSLSSRSLSSRSLTGRSLAGRYFRTSTVVSGKRRVNFSANATLNLLRRFDPMAGFDWHSLSSIAQHAQELSMPADRLLIRPPRRLRGVWYLASGTLIDEASGVRLRAGSMRCRLPVYPGAACLRSLTPVRLLFFNESSAALLVGETSLQSEAAESFCDNVDPAAAVNWLEALAASPLLRFPLSTSGCGGLAELVAQF